MSRTKYKSATPEDFGNDGSALRFKFGLESDFSITDRYAFSTGLIYAPKRLGFTRDPGNGGATESQSYKAQYLQVPLTLKLYTNEVKPDVKPFFQLGFLPEIRLFSEAEDEYQGGEWVEKFNDFDMSFHFGAGIEYGAGINSVLYASIYYNRGLANVVKRTNSSITDDLVGKLDMIGIQVGVKF